MFHLQLAGYSFSVDNHFDYLEKLCRDYRTDQPGELISIEEADLAYERGNEDRWAEAYLESLAAYRKICERLVFRDILLFHCSALKFGEEGYLFTAPSGTGKSTHTRLWREFFGSDVRMINDDKPLLHVSTDKITVYGTPFAGKEGLQENISAPVKGIVILHQSGENSIRRLSSQEAYPLLLNQTYRPRQPEGLLKTLELVQRLADLPVYSLGCTISTEAVELACHALTGKKQNTKDK